MIKHLVLDIEGTTCPVHFVSDVLFPYASNNLNAFIEDGNNHSNLRDLIDSAWEEWKNDKTDKSQQLLTGLSREEKNKRESICTYLQHLINIDRKSTVLKDLQGMIWAQGYEQGHLRSELYPEAAQCMKEWVNMGLLLSTYSSGSIQAQKLLYGHTKNGNLCTLFWSWFDTHTGSKKEVSSYELIAKALNSQPESIVFISDSHLECDAARQAGMLTLFSQREGNPDQDSAGHTAIQSLNHVIDALPPQK